jgi:zinc transport system substrate-binding protein
MRTALSLAGWMAAALAAIVAGCASEPSAPAVPGSSDGRLSVYVSIPPEAGFVEAIGGNLVAVGVLVPPGQSPHAFEPTPRQMTELGQARIYFSIGWPFEKRLLEKVTAANRDLKVVDLRQGITLRMMTAEEQSADHDEPPPTAPGATTTPGATGGLPASAPPMSPPSLEGVLPAATTGEPDPHIWLSPRNIRTIAAHIAGTLAEADPAHAEEYAKNLKALEARADAADARVAAALAPLKGKEFFVFHPAFGYFADAYGLRQVPVEVEGKEPSARQLGDFVRLARARGIRVIFVQPQFSTRSAESVAREIGGAVIPMNDLAQDTLGNLEEMATKIQAALGAAK